MIQSKASILAFTCAAIALTASCNRGNDDLTEAAGGCEETATVVSADQMTDLGFSAADVLSYAAGEFQDTFEYTSGETTGLTLTVSFDSGEARYIQSRPETTEGDSELILSAPYCEDRLEIDVTVTFATDDGQFNESWTTTLTATTAESARFSQQFTPDALQGTYTVEPPEGAENYDEATMMVEGTLDASGTQGTVSAQFSGSSEDTEAGEGEAWAALVDIGHWPLENEEEMR